MEEKKPKKTSKKSVKKPAKKTVKKSNAHDENAIVNGRTGESTDQKAWERRRNESNPAWEAFQIYLKMEDRSVIKVSEQLGKARQLIGLWAQKHDWKERAHAFDSDVMIPAAEEAKEKLVDEFTEIYSGMTKSAKALMEKADAAMKSINIADMSPRDVTAFFKTAAELMEAVNGKNNKPEDEAVEADDVQIYLPDNGRMESSES